MRCRVETLEEMASELNHIETPYESCEDYSSTTSGSTSGSTEVVEEEDDVMDGFQTLRIIKDICDRELKEKIYPWSTSGTIVEENETEIENVSKNIDFFNKNG